MRLCKEAKFGPMSMLFFGHSIRVSQETSRDRSEGLIRSPLGSASAFLL
jgi:hypothetical protein